MSTDFSKKLNSKITRNHYTPLPSLPITYLMEKFQPFISRFYFDNANIWNNHHSPYLFPQAFSSSFLVQKINFFHDFKFNDRIVTYSSQTSNFQKKIDASTLRSESLHREKFPQKSKFSIQDKKTSNCNFFLQFYQPSSRVWSPFERLSNVNGYCLFDAPCKR